MAPTVRTIRQIAEPHTHVVIHPVRHDQTDGKSKNGMRRSQREDAAIAQE